MRRGQTHVQDDVLHWLNQRNLSTRTDVQRLPNRSSVKRIVHKEIEALDQITGACSPGMDFYDLFYHRLFAHYTHLNDP
jgi:hypothetical protein